MLTSHSKRLLLAVVCVACSFFATNAEALCTPNGTGGWAPPGALGIDGARFTVKNSLTNAVEPKFLGMFAYFGAMYPNNTAYPFVFSNLCGLGFSGVRIFADFWVSNPGAIRPTTGRTACRDGVAQLPAAWAVIRPDGSINEPRFDQLKAVLDSARLNGLVVDLSFAHEVVAGRTPAAHAAGIAAIARRLSESANYDHVMFDVQNEWDYIPDNKVLSDGVQCEPRQNLSAHRLTPSSSPVNYLPSLIAAGKSTHPNRPNPPARVVLASSGESIANHDLARQSGATAIAPHDARVQGWPLTPYWTGVTQAAMAAGLRLPIYAQEPNCVSPGCSNLTVLNDDLYWSAVNAKGRGAAAWTFHNEAFFYATNTTYPYGLWPEEREFLFGPVASMWLAMNQTTYCWGAHAYPPTAGQQPWMPVTCTP